MAAPFYPILTSWCFTSSCKPGAAKGFAFLGWGYCCDPIFYGEFISSSLSERSMSILSASAIINKNELII